MRKVLATVLAGAMVLSLSSVAFAANVGKGTVGGSVVTGNGGSSKTDSNYFIEVSPNSDNAIFEGFEEIYTWGNDYNEGDPRSEIKVAIVPNNVVGNRWDEKFPTYRITDIDAHVNSDNISASVRKNDGSLFAGNAPVVTIKAKAGVRDFELEDWELDVDMTLQYVSEKSDKTLEYGDKEDITITLKQTDGVAYSRMQEIQADEKYSITKEKGSISDFDEVIDEETRIRAHEYVDVFFKGNYGTDKENMRVVTDEISEVEAYFDDVDVDYYDFIATPKFASKVKVVIDADPGTYLYEFDKSTGDLTKIDATYESDGWAFTTKTLGTYVITEEEYEAGNVTKEEVDEEPTEDETPSKANPGTGAPEL